MPVLTRMLPSPLHVDIRSGSVEGLGELLHGRYISASGRVLVAVGPSQGEEIWRRVAPVLPDAEVVSVTEASLAAAGKVQETLAGGYGFDAIVAIGGGRTLDVAKYAATRAGVPMVAVATNLAHDGLCSPVASLEHAHGKGSYGVAMPLVLVVDLDYVKAAPPHLVTAGVGDVVSNLCAIADWTLAHDERAEPIDGLALAFAQTAAEAVLRRTDSIEADDFLVVLAESLVLSGMAMSVAGTSRPCSGACHEIIHAVDQLFPGTSNHGELAGLGALFATHLRRDDQRFEQIASCLAHHQLARVPEQVGLSDAQFVEAVLAAPGTRPDRYTILEHLSLSGQQVRAELGSFTARLDRA